MQLGYLGKEYIATVDQELNMVDKTPSLPLSTITILIPELDATEIHH